MFSGATDPLVAAWTPRMGIRRDLFRQKADRTVTTLHSRQDFPDLKPLYVGFSEMPLVSISNDQRRPIAKANFVATVHHGIPTNLHTPIYNPRGGYVAFLGRVSPEKGPDSAIRIARMLLERAHCFLPALRRFRRNEHLAA
jgi:glycosyltransferase involved in cell wall biosynthesis